MRKRMRSLGIMALLAMLGLGILYGRSQSGPQQPSAKAEAQPAADSVAAAVSKVSPDPSSRIRTNSATAFHDPIFVGPCHLLPKSEQEVASPVDGLLGRIVVSLGQ